MQLPSLDELMVRFHTSRPTVCKALKTLTDEGIVKAKRGVGMFINSQRYSIYSWGGNRQFFVGVVFDDGRDIGYTSTYARMLAALLNECSTSEIWLRPIQFTCSDSKQIYHEIEAEHLDGIIAITPIPSVVDALMAHAKNGLKLVLDDCYSPDVSSVKLEYSELGGMYADELMARKIDKMLFYPYVAPHVDGEMKGLIERFSQFGKKIDTRFFLPLLDKNVDPLCHFAKVLKKNPDIKAVYIKNINTKVIYEYFAEYVPEVIERCILLGEAQNFSNIPQLHGLGALFPLEKFAQLLLSEMHRLLEAKTEPIHYVLGKNDFKIIDF